MARLKITIEGEMSPEEIKRYIVAAWAGLPHEVAVSEVDMREPAGTVEVPVAVPAPVAPVPVELVPVVESPAPAPAPAAGSLVDTLNSHKKLSQILQSMVESGLAFDLPSILSLCRDLQSQVPMLERLGASLEDRVTRTWAGMQ